MPEYSYRAVSPDGKVRDGQISASCRALALELLQRAELTPVGLWDGPPPRRSAPLMQRLRDLTRPRPRARVPPRDILLLTRSLGALLKAGMTVDRALQICSLLMPGADSGTLAQHLLRHVRTGKSLSVAWAMTGTRLPPYFVSLVEAGELGGRLPQALEDLAQLMQRELDARARIASTLVYPAMLAVVVCLTLALLVAFVLPRFEALFADAEAPLPWSTALVLGAGRFIADYAILLLAVAMATTAGLTGWLRTPSGRKRAHRWLLRTRLLGGLPASFDTARLTRTIGSLCHSGLTLPAAMRVAEGTVVNLWLKAALQAATRRVQAGESLSAAMSGTNEFSAIAVQLARVGEESGQLPGMLLSAAEVLERDGQERLERLLVLLVPALTIAMGVLVAGLIGSVLVGLLSINELALY